jgi:two-component system NtrC family sensor kinase
MELAQTTGFNKIVRRVSLLPYLVSLLILGIISFTGFQLISFPDDGIDTVNSSGMIVSIVPGGPTYGKLKEGDVILSIDGKPYKSNVFNYMNIGKASGDPVQFIVMRGKSRVQVTFNLAAPTRELLVSRLATVLIAFVFWLIGVGIEAFKPSDQGSPIYFMWFNTCALILTTGAASTMRIGWATTMFLCLVWLIGPVSVNFHLLFPQPILKRGRNLSLLVLYAIGMLGIIPVLQSEEISIGLISRYPNYVAARGIFLSINLILVVWLLFYSYRNADSPGVRGKVRLVLLGGALAAIPFTILTTLPDILFRNPLIPYSVAFLFLGLLPLTYGFAIFRLHLIEIDQKINRGATYILVYSILGGFYLVLYAVLNRWLPEGVQTTSLINTILVLVLASAFIPLHRKVQQVVDRVFYGGYYDYRIGIREITENLSQLTDLQNLARAVSQRLKNTLRLEEAVVFLRDPEGEFSVVEASFSEGSRDRPRPEFPVLPRSSLTYLMKIGATERRALLQALSEVTLTPEEIQLLRTEQIHLWVPVIGHAQIQGLLALGPKVGGDVFSGEDMDILRVVVQQLSPIIENIHLLIDLKRHASELEKRVEERTSELYDAKERVEAILASVGDGVVVTNLAGEILTVNLTFERLSGFSMDEIRGVNLFEMMANSNGAARISAMQELLSGGEVWSDELIGRRKDNSQYTIRFTIAPIHDRHGQTVGYVGSQTDITRQKELDLMKDAFVSDVSHELRTPITNISLYIELLKSAPADRHSRYLAVVKDQSEQLNKLVEDILDLSRLTASKNRPMAFTPADLNLLAARVVSAHLPLAEACNVNLDFTPDAKLPVVCVEQNQIARMITNLVTNAIRYAPGGQVKVTTSHKEGWVCIKVKDTGLGIDSQDTPHIFERFYRGRNVRQSGMHGTGLGLAIVKEIVDFHAGEIEVESKQGKGSTFRVWLPLTQP